jgi:hypothetical protein
MTNSSLQWPLLSEVVGRENVNIKFTKGPVVSKVIHFIFGLDEKFIDKPFSFFNYLCILSAKVANPSYQINIFYKYRPNSIYFDKLESFCNLINLDSESPLTPEQQQNLEQIDFKYVEHKGDLLRLYILYNYGGIYLDVDVVCMKSFDNLLVHPMTMGKEYARYKNIPYYKVFIGLCNAVILCEPKNPFIQIWIDKYFTEFKREVWDYNSIQVPSYVSKENPHLINIQPQNSFFKFSYDCEGFLNLFEYDSDISDCYCLHLWTSMYGKYLDKYNKESYFADRSNTLSKIFKEVLRNENINN